MGAIQARESVGNRNDCQYADWVILPVCSDFIIAVSVCVVQHDRAMDANQRLIR